jgi:hypothetical protein
MIATLFLGFVALMAALVGALSARYLNGRSAIAIAAGLFAWLTYVGLLGFFGVIGSTTTRPPGIVFMLVPILIFFVPLAVMLHLLVFRIIVSRNHRGTA